MKTKPNKFESGEQLISLWTNFCDEIIDNGFDKVPTQTAFCKWLAQNYEKTDRHTIYNSLNRIFPTIKKDFEQIQADTITTGGMLGKYQSTMSIFALKNWCNWKDKADSEPIDDNSFNKGMQILADLINNPLKNRNISDFEDNDD